MYDWVQQYNTFIPTTFKVCFVQEIISKSFLLYKTSFSLFRIISNFQQGSNSSQKIGRKNSLSRPEWPRIAVIIVRRNQLRMIRTANCIQQKGIWRKNALKISCPGGCVNCSLRALIEGQLSAWASLAKSEKLPNWHNF